MNAKLLWQYVQGSAQLANSDAVKSWSDGVQHQDTQKSDYVRLRHMCACLRERPTQYFINLHVPCRRCYVGLYTEDLSGAYSTFEHLDTELRQDMSYHVRHCSCALACTCSQSSAAFPLCKHNQNLTNIIHDTWENTQHLGLFGAARGHVDSEPAVPLAAVACTAHLSRRIFAAFSVLLFQHRFANVKNIE